MEIRHSQFTFADFDALRKYSTNTPLRTIAHVDLDAFYAQCESVRLGLDPDIPLACQQWRGLIAVNYAARKYGISRHEDIAEAKKKCPELVLAHVATWKEGDTHWAYRPEPDIRTHKVSLDPYRRQSQLIFKIFYSMCEKVEYGGLDEAFLDLSKMVFDRACRLFPGLLSALQHKQEAGRMADFMLLPDISPHTLRWEGEVLPLDEEENSDEEVQDWDTVVFMLASMIIREVRTAVWDQLRYTCSAGVAKNRVLAKLCSAYKKPNNQTILRVGAVRSFMSTISFSKLRGLGGKLGKDISRQFHVPESGSVDFLLKIPLADLVSVLGDETGDWLYNVIRGIDTSEVSPRTIVKSMLSAKNFRPNINSNDQADKWLRIFVSDIMGRIFELRDNTAGGTLMMPKTVTLHHRHAGGVARSRQCPLPVCQPSDLDETIFNTAKSLLRLIEKESQNSMYPCYQLSLAIRGFDTIITRNRAIDGFLVKSNTHFAPQSSEPVVLPNAAMTAPRKSANISTYLQTRGSEKINAGGDIDCHDNGDKAGVETFVCDDCGRVVRLENTAEHQDWHYACVISEQLKAEESSDASASAEKKPPAVTTKKRKSSARGSASKAVRLEKGQTKLFE